MGRQPHGLEFGDISCVSGARLVRRLMDGRCDMAQREVPGRSEVVVVVRIVPRRPKDHPEQGGIGPQVDHARDDAAGRTPLPIGRPDEVGRLESAERIHEAGPMTLRQGDDALPIQAGPAAHRTALMPLSTCRTCPVMAAASGDSKKAAMAATSSAVDTRFKG